MIAENVRFMFIYKFIHIVVTSWLAVLRYVPNHLQYAASNRMNGIGTNIHLYVLNKEISI